MPILSLCWVDILLDLFTFLKGLLIDLCVFKGSAVDIVLVGGLFFVLELIKLLFSVRLIEGCMRNFVTFCDVLDKISVSRFLWLLVAHRDDGIVVLIELLYGLRFLLGLLFSILAVWLVIFGYVALTLWNCRFNKRLKHFKIEKLIIWAKISNLKRCGRRSAQIIEEELTFSRLPRLPYLPCDFVGGWDWTVALGGSGLGAIFSKKPQSGVLFGKGVVTFLSLPGWAADDFGVLSFHYWF